MQPSCGQSEPSDDEVIPSLSCNTRLVTAVWEMRVDHNTTVAVGKACWKPINDIHSIAFSHYHMPNPYHVMNKPCDNGTFLLEGFFFVRRVCVGAISHNLRTKACSVPSLTFQQSASSAETGEKFQRIQPSQTPKRKPSKKKRNGARYHRNASELQL